MLNIERVEFEESRRISKKELKTKIRLTKASFAYVQCAKIFNKVENRGLIRI